MRTRKNNFKDKGTDKKSDTSILAGNRVSNLLAFGALIISVLSWISSCDSNKTSREANKISQEAIKIAKITESPCLKLNISHDDVQDKISVHNEGGIFRELEAEPQTYLFWRITTDKTLLNPKEIIVLNYYNMGSRNSTLLGKTPITILAENPAKAEALQEEAKKLAGKKGDLMFISPKCYVRLQYKDIYDESHDDMYEVTSIDSKKMSKEETSELIQKYNQYTAQGLTIDMSSTITPEILYEKWKT